MTTAASTARPTHRRYLVAVAISFAFFVAYFDRTNVSVLIANNDFNNALGIADSKLKQGLLLSGFLLPYGFANFVTGPLGDRIGGRRGIIGAILIWTVLMAAMGAVSSFGAMMGLRIALGFGESIMTPACNRLVAEWFPTKERARANSAWLAGLFVAPVISYPALVWIINSFGWRASFYALAAVGFVIGLPLVWWGTTERPETAKRISASELQHIRAGQTDEPAVTISWRRLLRALANHRMWIAGIAYMGYGVGFWGFQSFTPSYLQNARGLDFTASGLFSVLPWVAATVLTIVGGLLGDRRPSWRGVVWSGGYAATAVIAIIGTRSPNVGLAIALISVAVGLLAFTLGPMWALIQSLSPVGMTAMTTGVANGLSYVASAFGPAVVGAAVDRTGSYTAGFYILCGFVVLTALVVAPLWRRRAHTPPKLASQPPPTKPMGDSHNVQHQ